MYNIPNLGNFPNFRNLPNMYSEKSMKSNSMDNSYYSILGVSSNASNEEIKKAYRKLSLENHPDRHNGNIEKTNKFKVITEAYKILSDELERKNYDSLSINNIVDFDNNMQNILNNLMSNINFDSIFLNNNGLNKHIFSEGNISNISNIMNGFSQHEYKSKPATISKTININLIQAYNGCKLPIDITRWVIEDDKKYEETETIYIDIFKGIDNNEIITLENKGNIISNSNKGDIKIKVLISNHNVFERDGIDLIFKKSITLKESFCGFSFDLPYIDGREFKINNEAGNIIPPNFKKIIPELGMIRDNMKGNMIIYFNVIYPDKFSSEQIKELEKIL